MAALRIEHFQPSIRYNSKVVGAFRDAIVAELEVKEVEILNAPTVCSLRIELSKLADECPLSSECELHNLREAVRALAVQTILDAFGTVRT